MERCVIMGTDELTSMWYTLEGMGVSDDTLRVVTAINGYSVETMEAILYAEFGYRSFDQLPDWR